jgi:hypothetical protein
VTKTIKRVRYRKGVNSYTYLGCPLTRNLSPWCYHLCQPDNGGIGRCGRQAPHGVKSKVQIAIENHKKSQLAGVN